MSTISNDSFASVCEIRHWSLAQKVNDFFLTVFESDNGEMFCTGQWDREHKGGALALGQLRSVMVPVILRPSTKVQYTSIDLNLLDAVYRDAKGIVVADPKLAATVHSTVYIPKLLPDMMRVFMLNAEGNHVLPGHTEFADAEVPYDVAKAIHRDAQSFKSPPPEPVFVRRQPEFFDGDFPPAQLPAHMAQAELQMAAM